MECECCGSQRPVTVLLRRTRVERSQTNDYQAGSTIEVPETACVRHPLCDVCLNWLSAVTGNLADPGRSRTLSLLGAPASRRRVRIFPDQCLLCREVLGDAAIVVDSTMPGGTAGPLPSMLVCGACDTWVGGLADDGRSARGGAERAIDGVYGSWPHPNLRSLDVSIHVRDAAMAAAIRESCHRMQIQVVEPGQGIAPVAIVEASHDGRASMFLYEDERRRAGRIVLARLADERDLKASIELGISTWLTIPVTPQQLTAALSQIALRQELRPKWDSETTLPILDLQYLARPAIAITPMEGTSPFETAWFTKRVSRGYDEVGTSSGSVILVPRAPEADIDRVRTRIERALAGRATVTTLVSRVPRERRLEAAG